MKEFIKQLQDNGIPVILFRDYKTKAPSISFTLVIISAVIVILGLIGKTTKLLGAVDIENSLSFFYGCAGMYIGRKFSSGKTTIDKPEN